MNIFTTHCFTGFLCLLILCPGYAHGAYSVQADSGTMTGLFSLGMTRHDLISTIGAPDRFKSSGRCLQYDSLGVSVFLNQQDEVDRIYLGRTFQGVLSSADNGTDSGSDDPSASGCSAALSLPPAGDDDAVMLERILAALGPPAATARLTYSPSSSLQNMATVELENTVGSDGLQEASLPLEYRGQRKLYELHGGSGILKYKYVFDDDGIAFYFDHDKALYATVIYPPRLHSPPQQLAQKQPEMTGPEIVHFDFDKHVIRSQDAPVLERCAAYLEQNPGYSIIIQGHTDAKGTNPYNDRLSERRARAIYDYLIGRGVSPDRLIMESYGERDPVAPNETPDGMDDPGGRAQNRRGVLVIRTEAR